LPDRTNASAIRGSSHRHGIYRSYWVFEEARPAAPG
jgi:hypothetical protein